MKGPGIGAFRALFPPEYEGPGPRWRPDPEFMGLDWTWRCPPGLMLELRARGFGAIGDHPSGGKYFVGIELNPEYAAMARERIREEPEHEPLTSFGLEPWGGVE